MTGPERGDAMDVDFSRQTVLVVDDLEDNRCRYGDLLRMRVGCEVILASGKDEALDILATTTPALVLLDVCVPTAPEGFEICRAIKRGHLRPEVQVVMITALADTDDILQECYAAGTDDFLARGATNLEVLLRVQSKLRAQAWFARNMPLHLRLGSP
jgi:CheY-like chemotaxis protein